METFHIHGGVPLEGTAPIRPSKNALLPCLAATLLTDCPVRFSSSSNHADISSMLQLLSHLGAETEGAPGTPLSVAVTGGGGHREAPYTLVRKMRASVLVMGPMVARYGRARVSLPGGCAIGTRPIDQHLKGLAALGANIRLDHGYVEASAGRLKGAEIVFDKATVGGTENILMAASLAEGVSVLHNCAREPEIVDLAGLLAAMGAKIEGAGTATITVKGVRDLGGTDHECIPDRIVAGTLLIAGAITGGDVACEPVVPEHLEALVGKLQEMGVSVTVSGRRVRAAVAGPLRSTHVETMPYPGFPTDLQAQFMALLTQAKGTGTVKETIFENRFMHVPELQRMGARIGVEGRLAFVEGPTKLTAAPVMASDLRASACLVLAGLCAEGETVVRRIYHLDRGYERLEERLSALGARVERVPE